MIKLHRSFLLVATLTGCSTLPRPSEPESADEALLAEVDAVELDASETASDAPKETGAPKEMQVDWEDNGQPIRPMSGPGRGAPLKPPVSTVHKKGSITSEDDKVPSGSKRKPKKKGTTPAPEPAAN